MKKLILCLVLSSCVSSSPPRRVEFNQCLDKCSIERATCVFGVKYCEKERNKCESKCK